MTILVDFSSCPINKYRLFRGANGSKISIQYHTENYMLKFATKKKGKPYTNECISEYIGCHIFTTVGMDAQETVLGTFEDKIVVACKNFNENGYRLVDFAALKNSCIHVS